jgi:MoxR-like ATPase
MTTATKGSGASASMTHEELRKSFVRVGDYLGTQMIERELPIRVAIWVAIAGTNLHLLGPPGTGKSYLLREFSACIVGADYFEKALNAGMPPDAVIGAYDMAEFARTGKFQRNVDGMLPTAHTTLIDELFRGNGPMQDALLTMVNSEERQYEFNGGMRLSKLLFFASASNHTPDADNEQAQALVDRLSCVLHIEPLRAKESFKEMLRRHQDRTIAKLEGTFERDRETITLEQVHEAQRQAKYVDTKRDDFLEAAATLWNAARAEGLAPSDRRWVEIKRVMQAVAWMNGRDYCTPEDVAVAEFGIATDKDHRAIAHKLVLPYLGRFEEAAVKMGEEAAKPLADLAELRPAIENGPVNLPNEIMVPAINSLRALRDVRERTAKLIAEADNEKREAAGLRAVLAEIEAMRAWADSQKLSVG